ncbi:hypothetical protein TevJSym_aj00770 [endosymbiont of Tevnia jerichonana (vent Tica)]|uniref:Uncharacterized protein n=1 Tax=endosymbiont of Tevnia jerichonana (vent Tica) TaxID=1049564 RepID=G2FEY0_9GAMM|nr:hypothetical protein TevJSym_aj00770 [endosymbiont of Tevnia jerichonana (vent Tica)]
MNQIDSWVLPTFHRSPLYTASARCSLSIYRGNGNRKGSYKTDSLGFFRQKLRWLRKKPVASHLIQAATTTDNEQESHGAMSRFEAPHPGNSSTISSQAP